MNINGTNNTLRTTNRTAMSVDIWTVPSTHRPLGALVPPRVETVHSPFHQAG
jgi:hypothetical protein